MHADPSLKHSGFLLLYNPLQETITRTISVPLYYTGLSRSAMIREKEGVGRRYLLDENKATQLTFTLPAGGYTYFVIGK
jgi:hypothetical protein